MGPTATQERRDGIHYDKRGQERASRQAHLAQESQWPGRRGMWVRGTAAGEVDHGWAGLDVRWDAGRVVVMTLHLETRAIHSRAADLNGSRPVSVPIYQTSVFAFDDVAACARALDDPAAGFAYSRYANPTTQALEAMAADLEGGAAALATSSGMGAINAVLLASLRPGDHVIAQRCLYGGTFAVFTSMAARYGIEVSYISGHDAGEVTEALRPSSRLLFLETIANPTIAVSDLPALIAAGHEAGLTCVVDNTFPPPAWAGPMALGADIVSPPPTKNLGAHNDAMLALVISPSEQFPR